MTHVKIDHNPRHAAKPRRATVVTEWLLVAATAILLAALATAAIAGATALFRWALGL